MKKQVLTCFGLIGWNGCLIGAMAWPVMWAHSSSVATSGMVYLSILASGFKLRKPEGLRQKDPLLLVSNFNWKVFRKVICPLRVKVKVFSDVFAKQPFGEIYYIFRNNEHYNKVNNSLFLLNQLRQPWGHLASFFAHFWHKWPKSKEVLWAL